MASMLSRVLSLLCLATGALLLYAALFLYEATERRIQDTFTQMWVRIKNYEGGNKTNPLRREVRFIRVVADFTSGIFSQVFGEKFFSVRFVVTSAYYSFASFAIFVCLTPLFINVDDYRLIVVVSGPFAAICVLLGSLPALTIKRYGTVVPSIILVALGCACITGGTVNMLFGEPDYSTEILGGTMMVVTGPATILSDAILIIVARRILRLLTVSTSFARAMFLGVLLSSLGIVLLLGPYAAAIIIPYAFVFLIPSPSWKMIPAFFLGVFSYTAFSNIAAGLVGIAFACVSALMILHPPALCLIGKVTYVLDRYKVVHQKRLLFCAGLFFLLFPFFGVQVIKIMLPKFF